MAYTWCENIAKLEYWQIDHWVKCDVNGLELNLRIIFDQLLITAESKVLETINMTNKMKGFYKDDVLILIIAGNGKKVRKIKFQIISNAIQSFEKLGQYFPVMNHNCKQKNKRTTTKFIKIEDVLKQALANKDIVTSINSLPLHEKFVKMCLLDPMFNQTIVETKHILGNINKQ